MEIVSSSLFATARSSFRSRLKSPTANECGWSPTGTEAAGANPPAPFPSRTETLSELMFAVATSSRPSRLKSAVEIEWGSWPTGNGDPEEGMNDGPTARALPAKAAAATQPIAASTAGRNQGRRERHRCSRVFPSMTLPSRRE
jgi:hypothetical protein